MSGSTRKDFDHSRWMDSRKTKESFLGVTAHWIEVKSGVWQLWSEVIVFQGISGDHGGLNLG